MLHLYTGGFVYIEGGTFEVVRWEQIEKIIYHKTLPISSPPFCHIYLTTNDKLAISGYIHEKGTIELTLNEYISEKIYLDKKEKDKDKYIDIGHLAD